MANHVMCSLQICGDQDQLQQFYKENCGDDTHLDFHKVTPPPKDDDDKDIWFIDIWGTKWNACEAEHEFYSIPDEDAQTIKHYLRYSFYTAWDEPHGWFKLVAEKYPELEFTMSFEDEGWMHCGEHEAFNGVVDYNKYEYGDSEFEKTYKSFEGEEEWEEFVKQQEGEDE